MKYFSLLILRRLVDD